MDTLEIGRIEVLSLGYTDPAIEATKRRWYEVLKPFSIMAHRHAANLAAHNWDTLLIGDRIFLFQTKYGGRCGHWLRHDGSREDATIAEMDAMYRRNDHGAAVRLFTDATPPSSEPTP